MGIRLLRNIMNLTSVKFTRTDESLTLFATVLTVILLEKAADFCEHAHCQTQTHSWLCELLVSVQG